MCASDTTVSLTPQPSDQPRPHVALFVSGGIAAYKACEVLRELQKQGCDVRVAMTHSATQLVGSQTFEALSGSSVLLDLFSDTSSPIAHIELAEWADMALICPATANAIAKLAHGIADDAVSTTLLACEGPCVVAPAMNLHMWGNPATQANIETLRSRGVVIVGPGSGRLACGDAGAGKLADVDQIVAAALVQLYATGDLAGRHILVTAGPTHETIDPVRFLSNASSGKMGYAIAAAAAAHGAHVTLISGPVELPVPAGVGVVRVTTAREMYDATVDAFEYADAAILAAAVSDYRPTTAADHKLKKSHEPLDTLKLVETDDILRDISKQRGKRIVIGFAAETSDVVENAQHKLARKGCDLIVANDVSREDSTFGSDTDCVTFVTPHAVEQLEPMPKTAVAELLMAKLVELLHNEQPPQTPQASEPEATVAMPTQAQRDSSTTNKKASQ